MIGIFRSKTLAGNESFICGLNASGPNFVPTPITSHSNRALYASEAYIYVYALIYVYINLTAEESGHFFFIYICNMFEGNGDLIIFPSIMKSCAEICNRNKPVCGDVSKMPIGRSCAIFLKTTAHTGNFLYIRLE